MKKIAILLLAILLCLGAFTACDTTEPDAPTPDAPTSDAPAPDVPAPDTPAPDTPTPDTPAPDTPEEVLPEPEIDLSRVIFDGKSFTYDGTAKSLAVQNLPDGVSVSYEGNGKTEAGVYTVTAKFYDGEYYLSDGDKTATLTISKAVYDMSAISFIDKVATYNGNSHSIEIIGTLPDGVSVSYVGNGKTDAGEYTVTAKFASTNANYEAITNMTAKLTIGKGTYVPEFLTDLEYNGDYQSITVTGTLPPDFTVAFTNNSQLLPGEYPVVAKFTLNSENYYPINDQSLTLKITLGSYVTGKTDFAYSKKSDNTYEITGYLGSKPGVVIPSEIDGIAVNSIATNAFLNEEIVCVHIADSVKNIGNSAFKNSTVQIVDFGSGVTNLGSNAFANTEISDLILPDSLLTIGLGAFKGTSVRAITIPFIGGSHNSSNDFLGYIFGSTSYFNNTRDIPATLKSVTLSEVCKEIPAYAFFGCASIENITIGSGVESIGTMAFCGCTSIRSIYIPATVTSIYTGPDASYSPFYNTSENLTIVFGHSDASGFGKYYDYISDTASATVLFAKSYSYYLSIRDSLLNQ